MAEQSAPKDGYPLREGSETDARLSRHEAALSAEVKPAVEINQVPTLPVIRADEDHRTVVNHKYEHCTVVHHHYYAEIASPPRVHRGQDRGPAAGPGPPQPASHRGPLPGTPGSHFFVGGGGGCSARVSTPFELRQARHVPGTARHVPGGAASRTRSRSQGSGAGARNQ